MDLTASTAWWVLAGVLIAAEMTTGTFYLLMVALGMAAGALAAHAGLGFAGQLTVAALISSGATALWHVYRRNQPSADPSHRNRDVNLDIGEHVDVDAWDDNRTARILYRGSRWTAKLLPGAPLVAGRHRVCAVEGNWLVLEPAVASNAPSAAS